MGWVGVGGGGGEEAGSWLCFVPGYLVPNLEWS